MKVRVMSDTETFLFEPQTDDFVIGRSSEADFTIESAELSRKHCKIYVREHRIFIEDLDSKNGVIVDGEKIPALKKTEIFPETKVMITKDLELSLFGGHTRTSLKLEGFIQPKPLVKYKKIKKPTTP